jgi:hypothetical protein
MNGKEEYLEKNREVIHFFYYWLPPLLLTAGIFLLAGDLGSVARLRIPIIILQYLLPSWSSKEIYLLYLEVRKAGHFLAYALLFSAYARAWYWHQGRSRLSAVLLALIICLFVSFADETRQSFHSSRNGSPRDVALDMSGALTAAFVMFPFLHPEERPK